MKNHDIGLEWWSAEWYTNIYPQKSPSFVGKYTSTMERMAIPIIAEICWIMLDDFNDFNVDRNGDLRSTHAEFANSPSKTQVNKNRGNSIYRLVNSHITMERSTILMGKSTMSMAIFNSYVKLPEGKHLSNTHTKI